MRANINCEMSSKQSPTLTSVSPSLLSLHSQSQLVKPYPVLFISTFISFRPQALPPTLDAWFLSIKAECFLVSTSSASLFSQAIHFSILSVFTKTQSISNTLCIHSPVRRVDSHGCHLFVCWPCSSSFFANPLYDLA